MKIGNDCLWSYCSFVWIVLTLLKSSHAAPGFLQKASEVLVVTGRDSIDTTVGSIAESWETGNDIGSIINRHMAKLQKKSTQTPIIAKSTKPEIYSFRIHSDIQYRYSRTYVTSRVANKDTSKSQEVTFRVVLPETAFISKFIMEIDGKSYEAYVKEKEEAKRIYNKAQSEHKSAGLVEISTRNSNTFNVNVNIKPESKVTFNLTYEELLNRRLGRYEQTINISPEQITSVKDFQISVSIIESQNITELRVPNLSNDIESVGDAEGNNQDAVILRPASNKANITWIPSVEDQENLSKQGVGGKFVVQYDVSRQSPSGEILVMEGYFVHFFAPENLKPLRKHVVFILDISGSMWGRKMEQLKESQKKILDDLSPDDFFNIITFSSDVFLWSPDNEPVKAISSAWSSVYRQYVTKVLSDDSKNQPYPATKVNIARAKSFIDSLVASGGTNIHDSIITAINLTSVIKNDRGGKKRTSISQEDTTEFEQLPTAVPMQDGTTIVPEEIETATEPMEVDKKRNKTILPKNVESLIIFLTDGEATVGVTDPPYIQQLIQAANKNLSLPIFSLGFGEGADFPFLRKLSLQNNGFARKIYEASDAALQLKGFYNEIASPLLSKVKFNYTSPEYNITDVTITKFPTVFKGTEIAIAGKLVASQNMVNDEALEFESEAMQDGETTTFRINEDNGVTEQNTPLNSEELGNDLILANRHLLDVSIAGSGREGVVDFDAPLVFCQPMPPIIDFEPNHRPFPPRPTPPPSPEGQFLERLWAYLTIQQLIEEDLKENDSSKNEIESAEELPSLMVMLMLSMKDKIESTASPLSLNEVVQNVTVEKLTPKQRAIQLALKYGFVTPFTSLVVVKPNSSDVTNTVPTDIRPEALDSVSAPQGLHAFAAYAPPAVSLKLSGIGNRIAGGPQQQYLAQSPKPIRRTGSLSSSLTMGDIPFGNGGFHASSPFRPMPTLIPHRYTTTHIPIFIAPSRPIQTVVTDPPTFPGSVVPDADYDSFPEVDLEEHELTTIPTPKQLTLDDIHWFRKQSLSMNISGKTYTIALNQTEGDDAGKECLINSFVKGECKHLKDCVQDEFISDMGVYTDSYFCPIISTGNMNYAGSCCSSRRSTQFEKMP